MIVGVPTEIKPDEARVALTPAGARELVDAGHEVLIQSGAGAGSSYDDSAYHEQGADTVGEAEVVFRESELIVKVKEPQPSEVALLTPEHVLFTYLHLAADPKLTHGLIASGATCVAYETVEGEAAGLPLLAPMSEVAGRFAAQAGAFMLAKPFGGRGLLMGGIPGVAPANVLIVGGGVVGEHAARVATGLGANTYVVDRSLERLRELARRFGSGLHLIHASRLSIEQLLPDVDLVIGAVLIHGARAPHVLTRADLSLMKPNSMVVDVSIDQGGCFETSRPTTHSDPIYSVDGVAHYCVANIPGAVPVTSTRSLTNATLPYILAIANFGTDRALERDPGFAAGLNVRGGQVVHPAVAESIAAPEEDAGPAVALT